MNPWTLAILALLVLLFVVWWFFVRSKGPRV
jgi:hypothetical protein